MRRGTKQGRPVDGVVDQGILARHVDGELNPGRHNSRFEYRSLPGSKEPGSAPGYR